MVKNLPAMQETRDRFLGWEDPLEKEMAKHSSTLAAPASRRPQGTQLGSACSFVNTHTYSRLSVSVGDWF